LPAPIEAEKRRLRAWARGLPAPPDGETRVRERLLALDELRAPGTVCLYAATGSEVPTAEAARELAARGATLVYPRVCGAGLELRAVAGPGALRPGFRGIPEPRAGADPVDPREVDLFVVPGLVFDRGGYRVGRGGGHYDRLLEAAGSRARRIGLCYADRVVARVPAASWDRPVHCVVTESEVIRT
jgi:5-formyltetrahydrofolate cyclo-ligase